MASADSVEHTTTVTTVTTSANSVTDTPSATSTDLVTDTPSTTLPRTTSMTSTSEAKQITVIELVGSGGMDKLQIKQKPYPVMKDDDVIIRVRFAGLNFADLMRRQGIYSPAPKTPYVPGFEASGIVEAVGTNVKNFSVDDRVMVFAGDGLWKDVICVNYNSCVKMPENMSFEDAAALLVNYITAYHILFEFGNLRENKSVLVHMAAGGVGIAAIQLCKTVSNVTVYGTASAAKHDIIKEIGCTHPIDYRTQNYVEEVKKLAPSGVDIIMDPLNGADSVHGFHLLRPFGRIIYYGAANVAAGGENRSLLTAMKTWFKCFSTNSFDIMQTNKAICGYHLGYLLKNEKEITDLARTAIENLLRLYKEGLIKPKIDQIFSFSNVGEAMHRMHSRQNIGKILLTPDEAFKNDANVGIKAMPATTVPEEHKSE
ncbi:unnamed protein product [Didymodactylos carnosus]|uniref:Enoyl reductase (ER) domain-containing protein n=1 Tax=Didymodactylos carnosus TaxID=1234261 RepID=A0A814J5S6_9BILA|nr:unnamed protein product [Didymodactylos carnosus]CAF1100069.1 unnamed protein product [Didymodactylos carnosus]CAF3803082.1 unnamed protein product [Didymodactylos carnosus]CAF3861530.1 unnamed protein product [Didymodactylos carnosus]